MEFDTRVTPVNNNENNDSGTQPNKRKRKKSIVWEYFTVETVGAGCTRAYCKQCKKSFSYITDSKLAGTSHLKRHISLGICQVIRQKNQQSPYPKIGGSQDTNNQPKKRPRATPGFAGNGNSFNQERCNLDIAKMIILHDYPLNIVEDQGFNDFVRTLQPQFNPPCFNSVEQDCVAMYLREKQNLLNLINGITGQVNLTLDFWTSNRAMSYVFIRGHFIDCDWNLHHPLLNVVMVPFPDLDDSFSQTIMTCLSDWHLEGQLFTLALHKSFSSETVMGNLRGLLTVKNPGVLNGQLLNQNCYARVLSRLAVDALQAMRGTVGKVRESVKYVKSSESHEEKFMKLKQQLQVPSMMDLLIDDQSKWDTTYRMLVAACELKEVFACFDTTDPDYRMALTMDEWKRVEILCTCLKYLYDAATILTAQPFPTANLFFHEVSKLQVELTHAALSQDPFLSSLILPLHEKFDQYWRESCLVLAIAVAMDPRHKMKLVEFTFAKIFGKNAEPWIRIVEDGLRELFIEYNTLMLPFTATNGDEGDEFTIKTDPCQEGSLDGSIFVDEDGFSDYEFYISDFTGNQQFKSELDEYLEEPLQPRVQEFDILSWWKVNGFKYPTLSRIASDVLSIPVSTLSADSVFNTEIRKMDNHRSSLGSLTLEALICAKDWFKYESIPIDVSNALVKMEF
ncbi:zinc finger BED domain-containing protein DAYSLEEPER-like [Gastrolobium bilobum]|uniref:zinc finger BED domain-containing protein DAYSLEEPER-like n=1 Tax=Gastrolobium bilobum TaxID=150636 RepID=UPI002AB2EE80|nr:zinc finger BED domain-containing protein DAYSLEEPER-like [Gastrolobium bilobum]